MAKEKVIDEQEAGAEIVPAEVNAIEVMERATIDVQIATAHRYPRTLDVFYRRAGAMVTVDAETAESCIYRRPVGKDQSGQMKYAEGESIRLAEIVAASYGNLRVGSLISEMAPRYVKAFGFAHDLENNTAFKAEVVESTVNKYGAPYSERMRIVIAKSALSKAIRDAIFRVVPKSLCKPLVAQARQIISGSQQPLEVRRQRVADWLKKLAIDGGRVFAALGVAGLAEMGEAELEILTGIRTSLADGDTTLEEAFPPIAIPDGEAKAGTEGLVSKLGGKAGASSHSRKGKLDQEKALEQAERDARERIETKDVPELTLMEQKLPWDK